VLGEQGVAKRQEIESKNKQKGDATRKRNDLQKAVFKDIDNLTSFIALSPTESCEELNQKIDLLRNEHRKLSKQQKNAAEIQQRKECGVLEWNNNFSAVLTKLNDTLQSSLQSHHQEAQKTLIEHIKTNFNGNQSAENWIRQGLDQNNSETCQFCGQTLSPEALALLEVYRQSFDTAYDEHDKQIQQALEISQATFIKDRVSPLRIAIESNKAAVMSYPEILEDNQEIKALEAQVNSLTVQLENSFPQWEQLIIDSKNELDYAIKKKLASPHKAVDTLQFDTLLQVKTKIEEIIDSYNGEIAKINSVFRTFKVSVIDDTIANRLSAIGREGKIEAQKLKRIELSEQCKNYKDFDRTVNKLKEEIPKLEEELEAEQSQFLDKFFDRLNNFFKLFGSHDFQLEKGLDTKGYKPIYYLKVKFNGYDISEKNLERVFSESDRRSLALSVFWAGVDGLSDEEKRNCIVVLDDPVTSFDNHRISMVYQEIVKLSDNIRQIILLSHFEQGVTYFLNTYRYNKPVKLLSIERKVNSSDIQVEEIENFIKTNHEKVAHNIFRFVQGTTNAHNAGDLRIFLEIEINLRFAKQLLGINEQNLSERIDKLKEMGAISEATTSEAHQWRETLNPAHHIWTGNDIEDQRQTATQFMSFIYYRLTPLC
jgi:wobble nucleotide-excising tRNase